jgi:hypothetical protein
MAVLVGAWLGAATAAYAAPEQATVLILLPGKPDQPGMTAACPSPR